MRGNKKKSLVAKSGLCGGWSINSNFFKEIVYHSELIVQRCWRRTVAIWPVLPKNRRSFASKCFFHKQLSLDLAHLRRPTRQAVVLFRAHTHRSLMILLKHRDRILPIFRYTNRHEPFFGRLPNCEHVLMQYWVITGERNAQGFTICHMTILHYQFTHGINVLWHNVRFRRTFADFVFERTAATIELIKVQVFILL